MAFVSGFACFAILIAIAADFYHICFTAKWEKYDFSSVVTAMILTLIMPATVPYWMVALGVLLAIFIAKAPFGGFEKYV